MKRYLALICTLLIFLTGIVGLTVLPGQPVASQANVPCYRMQGGAKNVAGSGCEYEYQSGSLLDAQIGSSIGLGGKVLAPLQTPVPVVYQTPIVVSGYNQPIIALTATAVVSFSVPATPGVYIITNVGAANITIDDAGNTVGAGDFSMGQYDTAWYYSDGTRMIELGRSNN